VIAVTNPGGLALGGDGFTVLKDGSAKQFGVYDDEALFSLFPGKQSGHTTSAWPHHAEQLNWLA
jgi:hypothetical protein